MLICTFPFDISASVYRNFEYVIINDSVKIIKYKGYAETAVIPSVIEGKPVTEIGLYAFDNNKYIVTVKIPASVTKIGVDPFAACSSLKEITVDSLNSNYSSVDGVLFNKDRTTLITFPEAKDTGLTPGYASGLGVYTIPSTVNKIDMYAFAGNKLLKSVYFVSAQSDIGDYAFSGCTSLSSLTLNGVKSIGVNAFKGCTSLISVSLPATLTSIGYYAFSGCTVLTGFTVDSNNNSFISTDGIIYNKNKTKLILCSESKAGDILICNTVTEIGCQAFMNCKKITSITLSPILTKIGPSAFHGCSLIKKIVIPDTVTEIGEFAFEKCTSLSDITLSKSLKELDFGLFTDCRAIVSITIPTSVTYISRYCFYYCTGLKNLVVPDSVTLIGRFAFYGCSGLESVSFGTGLTEIGMYGFTGCKKLTSAELPAKFSILGKYAFSSCSALTSIYMPKTLTSIGTGVLSGSNSAVISCYADSCAHAYAIANSIPFNLLSQTAFTFSDEFTDEEAVMIYEFVAGMRILDNDMIFRGDINKDGKLDLEDAMLISRSIL